MRLKEKGLEITKEQMDELLEASKPLMRWLSDNVNPHASVVVDSASAELQAGIALVRDTGYLKD